jgi:hypothetical protein
MESILSQLLVFGVLVFLAVGSGVLFWDGLALGFGHGRSGGASVRLARFRLIAGLLGVALAVWLAAGYLTRVH